MKKTRVWRDKVSLHCLDWGPADRDARPVLTPATLAHVEITELTEDLGYLRLRTPETQRDMEQPLVRHGQLTPILACREAGGLTAIDAFMRLRGARVLSRMHGGARLEEGDLDLEAGGLFTGDRDSRSPPGRERTHDAKAQGDTGGLKRSRSSFRGTPGA